MSYNSIFILTVTPLKITMENFGKSSVLQNLKYSFESAQLMTGGRPGVRTGYRNDRR